MARFGGFVALAVFALIFILPSVSAQSSLTTIAKPSLPALVFGEMYTVGAPMHFLVCGDLDCTQQRYSILDSAPNAYTGMYIDIQTPPDGKPFMTYVVYYHPFVYELRTLKCGNPACSQGNVIQSIAFVDYQSRTKVQFKPNTNFPAWVYSAFGTSYFVQCSNTDCSQRVQNAVGSTTTLKISNQWIFAADGTPMILTLDGTILKCSDSVCSTAPTVMKYTTNQRYNATSARIIQMPDGKPVITIMNAPDYFHTEFYVFKCLDVRCAKRTDVLLSSWQNPVYSEFEHDLVIGSDGYPAIVYQNQTSPVLNYVHCKSADCRVRADTTIDMTANPKTGIHNSLLIGPDGFPIIAHHNKIDLFYAHCTDLDCSTIGSYTPVLRNGVGNHVATTLV